jgi:hypothetical protein
LNLELGDVEILGDLEGFGVGEQRAQALFWIEKVGTRVQKPKQRYDRGAGCGLVQRSAGAFVVALPMHAYLYASLLTGLTKLEGVKQERTFYEKCKSVNVVDLGNGAIRQQHHER